MSLKKQPPDSKVNSSIVCLGDSNANSDQCEPQLNVNDSCSAEKVENLTVCCEPTACTDPKQDFKNSVETMIMKRLLQKAKQSYDSQAKTHQEQNRTGRSVKKKLRRRYKSSKRKSKDSSKDEMSESDDNVRTKSSSKPLLPAADSSHLQPLSIEVGNLQVLNQNSPLINDIQPTSLKRHSMVLGRKKFTLPIVSARSSRRIFPQKRYLQEEDLDVPPKRNTSANSGKCTLLSNSAASKGNHTVNSNPSKKGSRGHSVPAPNQLLLTEGKRHWKSSAKLDLSQISCPLSLQKNCSDGVLRNSVCSASSSEFIKPDMVSKYADKMAEKPKERRLKNGDGRKSFVQKPDATVIVKEEKWDVPEKKAIDPLERIAAKIEKILKSQWEGRLNKTTNTVPPPPPPVIKSESQQTMKVKTSPLSQWKSEQEQRACDRKRTKNLIRKARLQLKKRTLMKLRQPQSIALLNEQLQTSKTGAFSDKQQALCSPTSLEWKNAPPIELKKSPVPKFNVPGTKACCVCDLSATISQVQKYYGQLACDACSKFFGNFIETPKQYFCPKDGNCSSSAKTVRNAKASNSRFRCRACWLKACMLNFSVSAFLREQLLKYMPRLEAPPHDALLDDNNALSRMVNLVDFAPSSSKVSKDPEVSKNNAPILEVCSEQTNQSSPNFGPLVSGGKPVDSALKGDEACKTQESPNQDSSSVLVLDSSHDATNSAKSMETTEQTSVCGKIKDQVPLSAEEDNERISKMSSSLSDGNFDSTIDNASAATTDGAELLLSKDNISNVPLSTLDEINVPLCEGRKTSTPSSPTEEPKSYTQLEIMAPLPAADDNANSSYKAEEDEATLPQMEEVKAILLKATGSKPRGPRIKHVCRRAAVVLGLPKATFTQPSPKKHFNLSALPQEEKKKLLATETDTSSKTETKPSKLTKSSTTVTTEASKPKVSVGISKKASLTIKKKQKKKLLLKKSFKRFRKHSFKKPMELTRKLLIKNQLKYSYKHRLTKASKVPLKLPAKCISKVPKFRKVRCKQCKGCLADDCGLCSYCLDKKKFGGPNLIKQACMHRICLKPMMPASEKKMVAAAAANKYNEEPTSSSFDHMNADSRSEDSVLGVSPSLLNSSCSPSLSPDNSSCGSSCSSSSSSSSSGSSSSSSDSNSSSSNDSSHSKHSNSSNNNSSSHCSNIDSIDKDPSELRNDTSEPSFLFETTFNNGFAVDFDAASSQTNFVNSVDLPLNACAVDADDFESSGSSCPGKVPCGRSKKTPGRQPLQEKGKVGRNTEKIFNIGFALITSEPLPLRTVCFLCGSAGEENFIYCVVCCEPYHLFCTGEQELPKNIDDWCCPKCQACTVCGLKFKLLKCNECQNAYHIDCLGSFYPSKPSKKKKIWVCPKCVKCKSCGTTTPSSGSSFGWNFDLLLCHGCTRLRDKGNFCPLCHKCYEDDDYDSEMMQCSKCDVWVHAKCERMTDEEYQILSALPETIIYTCFNCTINFPPMWKLAVGNAFDSGLKSVMNTLLNAKCMKHLVSRKTESEKLETSCSSNSLLNICPRNRGVESDNQSIHEPELPKAESCLPNGMCDGSLTIETALHKADAFERPFASATNHCLEFSSPISSKSSVVDSGIECDNSEGDMDKNEITQSDQNRNTFSTTGISSSCKANDSNEVLKGSSLTVAATWSSSSQDPSTESSKVKSLDDDSSSQQSCASVSESVEHLRVKNTLNKTRKQQELVDLMTIKRKLSCRKYKSVNAFVNDVVTVIDSREADGKKDELVARSFFSKLIEKAFPWFEVRDSKLWDNDEIRVPNDFLPHAIMPPNDDHMYASYLKPSEPVPFQQPAALKTVEGVSMGDLRKCALCGTIGDDNEKEKGRLLYCGQDDWIHLNCALWSAEVFQESDGLLKNVYSAISRGRLMRCESCDKYGATVGCCVRGCPSNFHYLCARKANALFQTDKKVFCEEHKYCNDAPIMKDDDFQVRERIYINQEDIKPKWIKKSWLNGQEVQNTHIVIGSLTVENLGCLTKVSDEKEHLIPVNFVCSRVFWSTKNPSQRVIYTCRTIEVLPEQRPVELQGTENLTISHEDTILTEDSNCPLLHQSEQISSICRLEENQLSPGTYITCNEDSRLVPSPLPIKDTRNRSIKESSKSSYTFQDRKVVGNLLSDILEEISHRPLQHNSSKRSRLSYRTRKSLSTSCATPKLQCVQNVNSPKSNVNLSAILSDETRTRNLKKHRTRINGSLKKHDMVSLAVQPHQSLSKDVVSTVLCDSSKNKDDQSEHFEEQLSSTEKTEIPENFRSVPIVTQHTINPGKTNNKTTLQQNFVLQNDEEAVKETGRRSIKESDKLNPKGYSHFPNKVNGLVDVMLPSSPITETVLPVYNMEKHSEVNGHVNCDSVLSANEHVCGDSGNGEVSDHESRSLRPTPARLSSLYNNSNHKNSFCIGNTNKRFKCSKLRKSDGKLISSSVTDECIEVGKKAMFDNGLPDNASLSPDVFANSVIEKADIDSATTVMDKVKAYSLHKNGCTKSLSNFIKNPDVVDVCERFSASNGCVQQDLGPFKCGKCKRSYRTKESFEKHISLCDFVIDSSSDDEEEEKLSCPLQQRNSGVIGGGKLLHPVQEDSASHLRVNDRHNEEIHLCKNNNSTLPEVSTCDTICEPPLIMRSESQGVVNDICHSNSKNPACNLKKTLPCATSATQPFNNKVRSSILPSPSTDHPALPISNPISPQSNIISSILPPPTSNCVELSIPAVLQSDNCSQVSAPIFAETVSVSQALPCNKTLTNQIYPKVAPPSSHISAIPQPLNIQSVNQQVNVHPINQSFEPIQLNNYNSIPIDQCGANVDIVSIPLASSSFQEPMNLGYGNAYANQHPDIVQMSNGTLIFPQEAHSQGIPTMSNMPMITNGFPQIYSPAIDLNQNSQFSYVGSITITNSASMSLSVNVPGQVIQNLQMFPPQVIPQQNLTFGQPQLMQVPLQLQSNTAVQMSTLNVQQLTLQSACANGGLAPVTFPQQTSIPGINSPVMFLEEAAVQSQMSAMSSFNQSSNLVLQMPIGIDDQSQTCYQPILSNGFVDPSNMTRTVPESFCETTICDSSLIPCDMQLFQTNLNDVPLSKPNIRPNAYGPSFQNTAHHQNNSHSTNAKPLSILPKTPIPVAQNVPNVPAANINNAEKPTLDITADDSSQNGSNSGNLVDILKKAAQQMLSLSAELAAKKKVEKPAEEEKKTRFAHTRKVAARKAQQYKNRMLKEQGKTPPPPKPTECLRLKISAIPTSQVQFSIPAAIPDPVPAEPACTNIPVSPQQLDISHSIVIDESSQHQNELNDNESYLLSLYNKKEKISLENQRPKDKPYILYEIKSEDGFCVQSHDVNDAWQQLYDQLQDARIAFKKKQIMVSEGDVDGLQMMGLHNKALTYLLEQLPGVENCTKYEFNFHKPAHVDDKWIVNPSGCARSEAFTIRREYDMFSFLASEHRDRPMFYPIPEEEEGAHKSSGRRTMSTDQPIAMRFRNLKTIARETVGVYRSSIHGRGLFCKRNIDPGELVIEYAGEVIRSVLTDKREQFYQSKGIGCYMFRIDDDEVVDATMHGNAARFINHSCEPNCFSKVITVDSKKHIVIFALRKILKGEELTYDYKFPFEEEKIPCSCNSRRCRKYLN